MADCLLAGNATVRSDGFTPSLSFSYYLSGTTRSTMGGSNASVEMRNGQQGIFYLPNPEGGSNRMKSEAPLRFIAIEIALDRLLEEPENDPWLFVPILGRLIGSRRREAFCRIHGIAGPVRAALDQIAHCPFVGTARRLYLESRALELIAHQLDRISTPEGAGPTPGIIRSDERERTVFARDLLVRDLENPPSLMELARTAGMSHPKLNRCFRKMYGMTVPPSSQLHCWKGVRLHGRRTARRHGRSGGDGD
jgi:AraC-like DNA-binding protein